MAAATMFSDIATNVLGSGSSSQLNKDAVTKLRQRCSDNGNIAKEFDSILALFRENEHSISILGNQELDVPLEKLAKILSSYIATANKSVPSFIKQSSGT